MRVCGEHYLSVHHCLLACRGQNDLNSINKLYTHPQAWGQCEKFLGDHFKNVERQDVSSTSKAAEVVASENTEQSAAIASLFAAEHHGLDVIEENIEDKANNTTRFLVLRNMHSERTTRLPFEKVKVPPTPSPTTRKTLISFMVSQNAPGALADALLVFKNHGMNLTSINTRPSQRRAWQYVFLVECQMAPAYDDGKEAMAEVLAGLKDVTENSRDLGTWNSMRSSGDQ